MDNNFLVNPALIFHFFLRSRLLNYVYVWNCKAEKLFKQKFIGSKKKKVGKFAFQLRFMVFAICALYILLDLKIIYFFTARHQRSQKLFLNFFWYFNTLDASLTLRDFFHHS